MARVTGPLMSMEASGTIGKTLTFANWVGRQYVRRWTRPSNPQTADQMDQRNAFSVIGVGVSPYRQVADTAQNQAQSITVPTVLPGTRLDNSTSPLPLVAVSSTVNIASSLTETPSSTTDSNATTDAGNSAGVTIALLRNPTAQEPVSVVVGVTLPKGTSTTGIGFSFKLPASIQDLLQAGTPPQANLPDGLPLPEWLKFDAQNLEFQASAVPSGAFPLQVLVTNENVRVMVVISERNE